MMNEAKRLIDEYCIDEFGYPADFSDLAHIGVGYTETETEELHFVQAYINLEDYRIETYLDETCIRILGFDGLEDMIEHALPYLDFCELTYVSPEELEMIERS
jgi:hypothetical protein